MDPWFYLIDFLLSGSVCISWRQFVCGGGVCEWVVCLKGVMCFVLCSVLVCLCHVLCVLCSCFLLLKKYPVQNISSGPSGSSLFIFTVCVVIWDFFFLFRTLVISSHSLPMLFHFLVSLRGSTVSCELVLVDKLLFFTW